MSAKLDRGFARCVAAVYACLTALVALAVALCREGTDFYLKAYPSAFLLSTPALLALGALLLAAAALVLRAVGADRVERALARGGRWAVLAASAAVLLAQGFVAVHAYFISVWDARYVIDSAYAYGLGLPDYIERAYLALYPNNATLVALYGAILRAVRAVLGIEPGKERFVLMLTLLQCAVNAGTGALLWSVTRALAARLGRRAHLTAWCAYAGYLALIACSPWFLVTYSDSTALFIPIACVWLYERAGRSGARMGLARMALLGALGAAGFLIKPQTSIPLIAALLCDGALFALRRDARSASHLAAALLAAAFVLVPVRQAVFASAQLDPDPPQALGAAHFFNMGLSPATDGAYDHEDVLRACAVEDSDARTRFCLDSALERIRGYGPAGLAEHLVKKALVNFSDGGFAWGVDFVRAQTPPKNAVSLAIRSAVYDDGALYPLLHTAQQLAWLLVLALSPFAALSLRGARRDDRDALCVPLLSVVGVVCFNMLFEAKARYMYAMTPVLLALFALACSSLFGGRAAGTREKREETAVKTVDNPKMP